jgi:hypothetical protein
MTQGLGAGARPEVGRAAAEETLEEIERALEGVHMCFIAAGMGGGTGTGAAPVIAEAARRKGVLTVGVVTKPFLFEGTRRMRAAESGINETLLAEAQQSQLIGSEPFEYSDIEVARSLMQLQRFGISARHLRGIKTSVDRDLGLIQGVVASVKKQRDPAAKSRAAAYANEIESHIATIRAELIRAVIDKID